MPPRDFIAKDHADWLAPSQAVEILDATYPPKSHVSKTVLLERLRGGMVQAVAGHSVLEGRREPRELFYAIPSEDWERVDTADILWITGELTYRRREYGRSEITTARHYNVRFEPQGVRAIIAPLQTPAIQTSTEPALEPTQKGPRVPDGHLKAWFEFYKAVRPPSEDTEDRALEFARQCFPGKSVSRDRVRELRGNVKRGPKVRPT